MPNKRPSTCLLIFRFFQPPDLIRTPSLNNCKEIDFFTNPSFHFLSFLVLFTPTIQGKMECFCVKCSSMLYDNLFLFFPSFYNHLSHFSNSDPPFILTPVCSILVFFPTLLFARTHPVIWHLRVRLDCYCTLTYANRSLACFESCM